MNCRRFLRSILLCDNGTSIASGLILVSSSRKFRSEFMKIFKIKVSLVFYSSWFFGVKIPKGFVGYVFKATMLMMMISSCYGLGNLSRWRHVYNLWKQQEGFLWKLNNYLGILLHVLFSWNEESHGSISLILLQFCSFCCLDFLSRN